VRASKYARGHTRARRGYAREEGFVKGWCKEVQKEERERERERDEERRVGQKGKTQESRGAALKDNKLPR